MDDDASVFGIQVVRRAPAFEVFYLWPENLPAWQLWLSVQTQWRHSMGGRDGLDYAGVESQMRNGFPAVRRKDWRRRWAELRIMEAAAMRAFKRDARKG